MKPTTLHKSHTEMQRQPLPNCHDGVGNLDWTNVLDSKHLTGRTLRFIHDDILAPGVSIGLHPHTDTEEYYYILEGAGVMTLDDQTVDVKAGDITAVFPGGKHALENTGDQPLRVVVIYVGATDGRTD